MFSILLDEFRRRGKRVTNFIHRNFMFFFFFLTHFYLNATNKE